MKRLSGKQGIKNQDRPMVCLHGAVLSEEQPEMIVAGGSMKIAMKIAMALLLLVIAWTSMLGVIRLLRDCAPHDQCGQIVGHRGILQIV
jgi:hypothetical protein